MEVMNSLEPFQSPLQIDCVFRPVLQCHPLIFSNGEKVQWLLRVFCSALVHKFEEFKIKLWGLPSRSMG